MHKENMSATEVIKRDHRAAEALLKKFRAATPGNREDVIEDIFEALKVHEKMEDKHFYPALKHELKEDSEFEELQEEQSDLEREVKEIEKDDDRENRIEGMMETVLAHARKEEADLLPRAERLLDAEKLLKLGNKMEPDSAVCAAEEKEEKEEKKARR